MRITYYGHSTFTVETKETTILIDPFITPNEVVEKDVNSFEPDYVFVTHGHEDHVADVETIAKNNDVQVIANYEVANWFSEKGIDTYPMNFGGKVKCKDIDVRMVTATHSSVLPDGSYGGNPAGFILQTKDKTVYISGDTDIHSDMNLFGEMFDIDVSILSIGGTFTMDSETAVKAMELLNCERAIGAHYDTFPPIEIDSDEAQQIFRNKGYTLKLLDIGGEYTI